MAYVKRYAGGFADNAGGGTPIDSAFLNAVEAALLKLLTADGSVDGQVLQWINASSRFGPALLLNKNVDPAAAIDKSKLNLAASIVDADISGAAAIAKSKINFGAGIANADISAAAAIALSKIAIGGNVAQVVKGDGSVALPGLYRVGAKVVNTTVAPTDLFSGVNGPITIAANLMGATGGLRVTAIGDWLQNSGGGAAPPRLQLVLGATTLIDTGTGGGTFSAGATRYGWKVVAHIFNTATNAQVVHFELTLEGNQSVANSAAALTTGEGSYNYQNVGSGFGPHRASGYGTGAEDTTGARTLKLNVINGSANAAYETKLAAAVVEPL